MPRSRRAASVAQVKGKVRPRDVRAISAHKDFCHTLLDTVGALVTGLDTKDRIVSFNKECERVSGYSADEVRGRVFWELLVPPDEAGKVRGDLARLKAGEFPVQLESHCVHRDGRHSLIAWTGTILPGSGGAAEYLLVTGVDISERRRMEEDLRSLSIIDDVTGLYNRNGFVALLEQQLKVARRLGRDVLLLSANLDGLQRINEEFGCEVGDSVLREAGTLLQRTFRESDLIARVGADELVVVAIQQSEVQDEELADRLLAGLEALNAAHRLPAELSLVVGVARFVPTDYASAEEMLAEADRYVYKQRRRTGSRVPVG